MRDDFSLSLTTHSNLRTTTLIGLTEGGKSLDALRQDLNVGATTASHALRELEEGNLVYQDAERTYVLTTIGKIVARKLIDFNDTAEILRTFESFWLEHDLSAIPDDLLDKIGRLRDSRIISGTPVNVFQAYSTVVRLLKDAKTVKVVGSIRVPDAKLLVNIVATDKDMQVILTKEVLYPYVEDIGREQVRKVLEKNAKLYMIKQNLKIGMFVITDRFLSLGLYRLDGTFSFSSHLMSCNKTAIDWGLKLFNHYAAIAECVDLS